MKYKIVLTSKFKKHYKQAQKRGYDIAKLQIVINILANGDQLPKQYKDHALTGNWTKHRECHLQPDWLLIYYFDDDVLVLTLTATGTHADLF